MKQPVVLDLYLEFLNIRRRRTNNVGLVVSVKREGGFLICSVAEAYGQPPSLRFQIVDSLSKFASPRSIGVGLCKVYENLFNLVLRQMSLNSSLPSSLLYPFRSLRFASKEWQIENQAMLSWLNSYHLQGVFSGFNDWFGSDPDLRDWLFYEANCGEAHGFPYPEFVAKTFASALKKYLEGDEGFELSLLGPDSLLLFHSAPDASVRGFRLSHWFVVIGMVDFKGG
jgi:hypothetical protein